MNRERNRHIKWREGRQVIWIWVIPSGINSKHDYSEVNGDHATQMRPEGRSDIEESER